MRFLKFAVLAALFALPISSANAGVTGSSLIQLHNLQFQLDTGGGFTVGTGTFFTGPAAPVADFRIESTTTTTTLSSTLTGYADGNNAGSVTILGSFAGAVGPIIVGDQLPVYSGSGGPPVDNDFTQLPSDYTRADALSFGSPIDITAELPIPFGASGDTFADFNVDTAGLEGGAISNVRNVSQFTFVSSVNANARLSMDALIQLALTNTGIPAGYGTAASSSFSVTLSSTGDFNDGETLGIVPGEFNQEISLNGAGAAAYTFADASWTSQVFELIAGEFYTFTINQTSAVTLEQTQIPEPTSMASFAVLGLCGLAGRRRRRRN